MSQEHTAAATGSPLDHPDLQKPTITVRKFAAFLGVDHNLIYREVREGKFKTLRLGRKILILTEPLRQVLAGQ